MKAAPRLSGRRHHALGLAELAQSAHPALGLAGAPVSKHQPSGCGTNGVFSCNVPFNGRPEFPAAAACCSVESRVRVCLSKIIGSRGILPPLVGLTSPGTHAARSRRTRAGSRGGCRMIAGSPADDHGRRSALCQSVSSASRRAALRLPLHRSSRDDRHPLNLLPSSISNGAATPLCGGGTGTARRRPPDRGFSRGAASTDPCGCAFST